MKFFKKLKSSNFWVSMISAVILILQAVFNVDIKTEYLNQIILGILGLLVMSGIVTDTNSNEMTVKQSIDLDSVKESINNVVTQISHTLQTDISNIVSQFENVKDTTHEANAETEQVVGLIQTNEIKQVAKEINPIETKPEDIVVIQASETKLKHNGVNQITEISVEQGQQLAVEINHIVEPIETPLRDSNAPKNEL